MLKKASFIAFLFLTFKAQAFLTFNPYIQLSNGSVSSDSSNLDASVNNQIFKGRLIGYGLGAKAGLKLSIFELGGVGDFQLGSYLGEADEDNPSLLGDYSNSVKRSLLGVYGKIHIPGTEIFVLGEYYASPKLGISDIDGETEITGASLVPNNPFRNDDGLKGTGFGVGGGLRNEEITANLLIRFFTYDKLERSGATINLPSTSFDKLKSWELVLQLGLSVDWFNSDS